MQFPKTHLALLYSYSHANRTRIHHYPKSNLTISFKVSTERIYYQSILDRTFCEILRRSPAFRTTLEGKGEREGSGGGGAYIKPSKVRLALAH